MSNFLPITYKEIEQRGWNEVDFVYVSGDAYVDHPSFGAAIITRVLEAKGYKVAFLSQPDFNGIKDFKKFGKPRLGFFVSS
ncbi:MAG: YgiQ family radical SAM protein, partial [Oscillospiraceae bacterium]